MASEDSDLIVMAGPCSVESYDQIMRLAEAAKEVGADYLRGGAFKPRTQAGEWTGYGEDALKWMRVAADEYSLKVVTEILDPNHIPMFQQYGVDLYQVGARNAQNQALLESLGEANVLVLLKNGMNTTMKEWVGSAGRITEDKVMLCARGKNVDTDVARNEQGVVALEYLVDHTPYRIIFDPSHSAGKREFVYGTTMGAIAVGVDGIIVEVHHDPVAARTDGRQAITPKQLKYLIRGACKQRELYLEQTSQKRSFMKSSSIPEHVDIYFRTRYLERIKNLIPYIEISSYEGNESGICTARLSAGSFGIFMPYGFSIGEIVRYKPKEGESSAEGVHITTPHGKKYKMTPFSKEALEFRGVPDRPFGERIELAHGYTGRTVRDAFLTLDMKKDEIIGSPLIIYRLVEE